MTTLLTVICLLAVAYTAFWIIAFMLMMAMTLLGRMFGHNDQREKD